VSLTEFVGNNEEGIMKVGDCFTIEPCLVQGKNSKGFLWDDGWTISTEVGAMTAHLLAKS